MVRTLTLTLGLALSLLVAQPASADSVTPTDLGTVVTGGQVGGTMTFDFIPLNPPPPTMGDVTTQVFFDGVRYIYTQTVLPNNAINPNARHFIFGTEFQVKGFSPETGMAGWRYSDASAAGGAGNGLDFNIEYSGGELIWGTGFGPAPFGGWSNMQPITFFFTSTLRPTLKSYGLVSFNDFELSSAQGLAPVPEPGSIALFGSGVVALYAAIRRRRTLKM
jgi:PEP-CTERM motif